MGLALFKERRLSERRRLTGLLPGRLVLAGTDAAMVCRPVDVSQNGMGIVIAKELEPGAQVTLLMKDSSILMTVAWVQPDFGKQDMFRYGLVTVNPEDNLEEIFIATGCLR